MTTDIRDIDAGETRRLRIRDVILIILAICMGLCIVAAALYGLTRALPYWKPKPDFGQLGFRRSIFCLVDVTRSEDPFVRGDVKEAVNRGILSKVGPGDFVACYAVDSDAHSYNDSKNRIFGDSKGKLVQARLKLADGVSLTAEMKAELGSQWQQENTLIESWRKRLEALQPPENSCCTAYLIALQNIESRLRSGDLPRPITLDILGDLYPEPVPDPFVPPPPAATDLDLYSGVEIHLVTPSSTPAKVKRDDINDYWMTYFKARGGEPQIRSLVGYNGIEPNSVPHG